MSPLETAVMRLYIEHEGCPREFAAVLRRYAAKAESAGRLTLVQSGGDPFLDALREIDREAGL
jgi:hypothetical protein